MAQTTLVKQKHDWGLVIAGALLIVLACVFTAFPGLTLVTITAIAGAGFLLAGIFDFIAFFHASRTMNLSGWAVAYAVLDIVLGCMLLLHPVLLASVIPWMVGGFVVAFGVFEIVAALQLRKIGMPSWGWMVFSGIVDAICGILFFVMPALLVYFLALFVIMRGVSLIIYGWRAESVLM